MTAAGPKKYEENFVLALAIFGIKRSPQGTLEEVADKNLACPALEYWTILAQKFDPWANT
ncbi:hypothetical protein FYJ24_07900 [Actinomycetaceae bacterium WB03_NA08]|uniref:Uncharacterized protein n=1 Tax=Scrofimicrobium canadense TaxID=2652290 RepID=A0A6N7W5U4_9ACTO|nr:hypothetical protein [Scrofimicrobium canadense]MSS84685.1 hypothetical protein [Scrofimicrobium canadense]